MAISHVSMRETIEPIQRSDCGRRKIFQYRTPTKWVVCKWGISKQLSFRRKKRVSLRWFLTFPMRHRPLFGHPKWGAQQAEIQGKVISSEPNPRTNGD